MNESRILAGLSTAVALIALVLSVLGIFGVTSFVVGQRTQEVGLRMAIGANAGDVVRLLVRQNMWPVVGGLTAGLAVALLGSRVLTAALSGISPYDPLAIVPAVVLLGGTALAAVAVPALRAARTDQRRFSGSRRSGQAAAFRTGRPTYLITSALASSLFPLPLPSALCPTQVQLELQARAAPRA